jgi:pSer/pThr/pTyr-binding forkhead associated (FHA) protein
VDGSAFPAWVDVGSFGGLACAVLAASGLAVWAIVYRRGSTRQSALAILLCLASAALMILPIWWDQSRFDFFGSSLEGTEVTVVLAWVAFFGWALPLGVLASFVLLAEPHKTIERTVNRNPHIEADMRLALADPARFVSVKLDDIPWAQLARVNETDAMGARPLMLRKRLTLIGREIDNDIVLNDERISRHHAEIRLDRNRVVLMDFGSTNGTLLNQRDVKGAIILNPGDILELGMRRYRFALFEGMVDTSEVETSKIPGTNGSSRRQTMPPGGPSALVAMNGAAAESRWELLEPLSTIGRDPSCQIRLPDTTVSRRHAQIVRQADGFYASDLESENGTQVNGEDLTAPRRLRNGDVLHLATVDLRFVAGMPDPADVIEPEGDWTVEGAGAWDGLSSGQTTTPLTREDRVAPPPDGWPDAPQPEPSEERLD